MSRRSHRLPLTVIATSSLTTACTNPIVGDWELTDVGGDIEDAVDAYDGDVEGTLEVSDDFEAELSIEVCYSYYGSEYCYDGTLEDGEVEIEGGGEYTITFDDEDIELECELSGGTLECEDEDGTYEFEKD